MDSTFSPKDFFERALQAWWWVCVGIIAGGVLGMALHALRPAVYQASASIAYAIDFTRSGFLTDIEEDQMLGMAGDVFTSRAVQEALVSRANRAGYALTLQDLDQVAFQERKAFVWVLTVRQAQPQAAADLVNLWAEEAYRATQTALAHAQNASSLQRHLDGLVSCYQQSVVTEPAQALCGLTLQELRLQVSQTGDVVQAERMAGQGLLPGLMPAEPQLAQVPLRPARLGQAALVLAGGLVGLLVSLLTLAMSWPERWTKVRRAR